ncbi:MAG: radical SAM protein [Desulfobacterales bacterium]|nr:MAG: radical SAM protein [Desulfobacterales bacterium]
MEKKFLGHVQIPLQRVHLELTNICEFNCRFCPKAEMTRKYGYMDTDLAKKAITEIGEKRVCEKVTFHVMGEPTLHRNFFEILDHAGKERVHLGLTTNGASLGGHVGKQLIDYDLYQLDVSIQTPDKASFKLRGAGPLGFEDYINGILQFFSEYKKRGYGTIIKFRFMNTRFPGKGIEKKRGPIRLISSTEQLREVFCRWANRIYEILGVDTEKRESAFRKINKLASFKWNVVEIYPNVIFETYVLNEWGNAFDPSKIRDAWGGYCFGMQDHFSILHNGDVILCCIDYDGRTAIGNLNDASLEGILSSDKLEEIVNGFKRFQLVHPHCKQCLGSRSFTSWMIKPIASVVGLKLLKPFLYTNTKVY